MSLEFYMADLDRIPAIQKEVVSSTRLPPNKRFSRAKCSLRVHFAADVERLLSQHIEIYTKIWITWSR